MIDIKDISHAPSLGEIGDYIGSRYLIRFANTWTRNIKQSAKLNTARMSGRAGSAG